MKHFALISIVSFLLFNCTCISAQNVKIGYINSQELLDALPESDSIQVKLEKYGKELQTQLEEMQVEYNKKLDKYQTEKATYSDLIKKTKEEELMMIQEKIQSFQSKAQQDMQEEQGRLLKPLIDKAKKAIDEVAKEQKYTYILDSSTGVIVNTPDPALDITALVKKKLIEAPKQPVK